MRLSAIRPGCLECCIDEISTNENLTCIRFHLSNHSSPSIQSRVFRIEIHKEDQSEMSLDSLGLLLSSDDFMFQSLKRIDLHFVKQEANSTLNTIARQLSCIAKANKGIIIYVNGASCDLSIPTHSVSHAPQTPGGVCCPRIKDQIGTVLVLSVRLSFETWFSCFKDLRFALPRFTCECPASSGPQGRVCESEDGSDQNPERVCKSGCHEI